MPKIYSYDFNDPEKRKPWREHHGVNNDQYFNYGFTETTWRVHQEDVKKMHMCGPPELPKTNKAERYNKNLDFLMPHEYGGFADPCMPHLQHLNIFTDEVDLPQLKPRTIQNAHEFYIEIPKES